MNTVCGMFKNVLWNKYYLFILLRGQFWKNFP